MKYYSAVFGETLDEIENDDELRDYIFENLTDESIMEAIENYCSAEEITDRMISFIGMSNLCQIFQDEIDIYIDNLLDTFEEIEEDEEDEEF